MQCNNSSILSGEDDIELGTIQQTSEDHIIKIEPKPANKATISVWHISNGLRKLIFSRENCPRIAAAIFLSSLSTGFNFLSPALLAECIRAFSKDNQSIEENSTELPWTTIVAALGVSYFLAQLTPNICNQIIMPVTANNVKKLMQDSAQHLLEKSLHYHVNTLAADKFYFIQKGFTLSTMGTPLLTQIFPMLIQIIVAGALLSSQYGIELGSSLLVLLSAYVGYSAFTAKAVIKENEAMLVAWNESFDRLMSTIERYKIIHDYGQLDKTLKDLDVVLTRCWKNVFVRASTMPIKISYGHSLISYTHMILAALYVGHGIKSNKYTVQDFVVIIGYLVQLASLMPAFGQAINQLFASYPDLKFVFKELSNQSDKMDNPLAGKELPKIAEKTPSIQFDHITYAHKPRPNEENPPILFQNLSLSISPNKLTAIVSESGVGKTTLFHLLARYYSLDHGNGRIMINEQDIATLSLKSLRKNIAVFYRDPQLFKGSLRENIAFGAENPEDIKDSDIEDIARLANLYDFLQSFPQKLNTVIGPDGSTLSDGQQQKIAILRGLMKKSAIWLMDEITSALDAESATQILEAIHLASNNATILMITHKLHEVAQYADEIIVINKESHVDQGQHDDLLDRNMLYRNLWQKCSNQTSTNPGKSSALGLFAPKDALLTTYDEKNENRPQTSFHDLSIPSS